MSAPTTDVQADLKVGDPTPTIEAMVDDLDRLNTFPCMAGTPAPMPGRSFVCTRPFGHLGNHVACAADVVAAVWGDDTTA